MKVGTSTKVTVAILGVLASGFIGFQMVKHDKGKQPDMKSSEVAVRQQATKSSMRHIEKSHTGGSERLTQQPTGEQIDEMVAWLQSLENEASAELGEVEAEILDKVKAVEVGEEGVTARINEVGTQCETSNRQWSKLKEEYYTDCQKRETKIGRLWNQQA